MAYTIKDIATSYLSWAPFSLMVREVTRINSLRILSERIDLFSNGRILDVGCGDGHWWKYILPDNLDRVHGVDISGPEIELAKKVITAQSIDITSPDFISNLSFWEFATVIGNCSLEHVRNIDLALNNIFNVLTPGGYFVVLVPSPFWALKGRSIQLLDRASPRLSMAVSGIFNGFFQHWHLYHHKIWTTLLKDSGFEVDEVFGLGNRRLEFLFRLGLPTAFISFLIKTCTGKYLNFFADSLVPRFVKNFLATHLCNYLDDKLSSADGEDVFEYMIVCRKNESF